MTRHRYLAFTFIYRHSCTIGVRTRNFIKTASEAPMRAIAVTRGSFAPRKVCFAL
jgi:hypothetical protein